jgi:nitroimidazol reductase NimA-like FMN-containing flavoprotein (pyridoxamine 5'-phosphate oxidase superfamily)
MDRVARAKEILERIRYITLATASVDAEPWSTPVTAAYDEQYNFYWTSMAATQHSQNIRANSRIYFSVFDSNAPLGAGGAVYVKAQATELTDPAEIEKAVAVLYVRKNKPARQPEEFLGESPKRMYKAVPEKVWVNLDEEVRIDPINARKEIALV